MRPNFLEAELKNTVWWSKNVFRSSTLLHNYLVMCTSFIHSSNLLGVEEWGKVCIIQTDKYQGEKKLPAMVFLGPVKKIASILSQFVLYGNNPLHIPFVRHCGYHQIHLASFRLNLIVCAIESHSSCPASVCRVVTHDLKGWK